MGTQASSGLHRASDTGYRRRHRHRGNLCLAMTLHDPYYENGTAVWAAATLLPAQNYPRSKQMSEPPRKPRNTPEPGWSLPVAYWQEELAQARERVALFRSGARPTDLSSEQAPVLEELSVTMEHLSVAEEELRAQNEEL